MMDHFHVSDFLRSVIVIGLVFGGFGIVLNVWDAWDDWIRMGPLRFSRLNPDSRSFRVLIKNDLIDTVWEPGEDPTTAPGKPFNPRDPEQLVSYDERLAVDVRLNDEAADAMEKALTRTRYMRAHDTGRVYQVRDMGIPRFAKRPCVTCGTMVEDVPDADPAEPWKCYHCHCLETGGEPRVKERLNAMAQLLKELHRALNN